MTRPLAQITTVRERLWLLAHDEDRDLQLRIAIGSLEVGLMGATIADLLLAGRITVYGDVFRPPEPSGVARQAATDELDPITAGVLQTLSAEPTANLQEVLRAARVELPGAHHPFTRLYQRTQAALVAHGILVEQHRRFRSPRYEIADPKSVARYRSIFHHRLVYYQRPGDPLTDCLCALAWALDLYKMLATPYEPSEAKAVLWEIVDELPARAGRDSPLTGVPQLAKCVRSVVGDLATAAF